jgi:hypothetical protein
MLWEGRTLNTIREADVRTVVQSGLKEHLQLEYKSSLYETNDRGRREFLLDICMFANTAGGVLLIGVPELRADHGQPTGAPDPAATLGVSVTNPEAELAAYDARVMEAIEERLALESAPISVGEGRYIFAIRVPNSTRKPHSVRYERHTYFPARRERQRYHLSVREIKELVMRTASRLQEAKHALHAAFTGVHRQPQIPYLMIGMMPVFSEEFLVDVRNPNVIAALQNFSRRRHAEWGTVTYSFMGLLRQERLLEHTVIFRRNGLLTMSMQLSLRQEEHRPNHHVVLVNSFDIALQRFVSKTKAVYEAAGISAPYVLGAMLRTQQLLIGEFASADGFGYDADVMLGPGDYKYPYMQIDDLSQADRIIRPLCDQSHQMFGKQGSPNFGDDGRFIDRYP